MARDTVSQEENKPHYAVVYEEDLASPEVRGLGSAAFRVWVTLKTQAFTKHGFGVLTETLGDFTGFTRRTIQRALAELKTAGLAKSRPRNRPGSGEQMSNHWTILEPPTVALAREAGLVPQQRPQGRQTCRPPWRHDRRPGASQTSPYGGVTDVALQLVSRSKMSVLDSREEDAVDTCELPPGYAGLWPGLLRMVADDLTATTLRRMATWALSQREPTRNDAQTQLLRVIRDLGTESCRRDTVERIATSGNYDMDFGSRTISGLRHAVRSGWSRSARNGFQAGIDVVVPLINTVENGDSPGLIRILADLNHPPA